MTLQRGYAAQLIRYLQRTGKSLPDVIHSLKYDPSMLDQETWEALYRLNRRPKPSYMAGLTEDAQVFIKERKAHHHANGRASATRNRQSTRSADVLRYRCTCAGEDGAIARSALPSGQLRLCRQRAERHHHPSHQLLTGAGHHDADLRW